MLIYLFYSILFTAAHYNEHSLTQGFRSCSSVFNVGFRGWAVSSALGFVVCFSTLIGDARQ
jgi:hypothetical protein